MTCALSLVRVKRSCCRVWWKSYNVWLTVKYLMCCRSQFFFYFFSSVCWPPHWWESSFCCALPVAQRLPITFAYTMWKKMLDVERGSYGREGCVCWQVSPTGKMLRLSLVSKKWIVIDCRFRSSYFWRCIVMMHITIYIYWWQLIHPHRADRPR